MRRSWPAEIGLCAVLGSLAPGAARAQVAPVRIQSNWLTNGVQLAPGFRMESRRGPIIGSGDLWRLVGLAGATLAIMPLDQAITEEFRDPPAQRSALLHNSARTFNLMGSPGAAVAGVTLLGAGLLSRSHGLTEIGLHATVAIAISGVATGALKLVSGRQRPYLDEHDSDQFALGGGLRSGMSSFPSGHTTAAFAFASTVTSELARLKPGSQWIAGPLLYGGAGMVGMARIYDSRHWASDVLLGAGIGTLVGLKVEKLMHGATRSGSSAMGLHVTPVGGGLRMSVSLPVH